MQDTSLPSSADSMVGKLLFASSTIQDPILSRSVSLVVHQDRETVCAVMLNRPMATPPGFVQMLAGSPGSQSGDPQSGANGQVASGNRLPLAQDMNEPQPGEIDSNSFGGETPKELGDHLPAHLAKKTLAEVASALGTIHFGGPLSGPVVAVHGSPKFAELKAAEGVYLAAQREMLENLVKQKSSPYRLIVGHLGWSVDQLQEERQAGLWHVVHADERDVFNTDPDLWPSVIRRATTNSLLGWLGIETTPNAPEVN
jgi:putative transcriptional regulator